jgi:hypothetical protein
MNQTTKTSPISELSANLACYWLVDGNHCERQPSLLQDLLSIHVAIRAALASDVLGIGKPT